MRRLIFRTNIINTKDCIIFFHEDKMFIYNKQSGNYSVEFQPSGKPANFSLEDFAYFINVVNNELSKGGE